MDKQEIFTQVAKMVAKQFDLDPKKVTKDLNFQHDLDADSIDLVEFVMNLEDHFGHEISDRDSQRIKTVGEAVDYIAAHTKNK